MLRGSLGALGMALLFLEIVVKEVVGKNQLARERVARGIVAHCKYVLLMYFVRVIGGCYLKFQVM